MLDKNSLNHEVSVGVTYASLMSAVALFFTGVLISQYPSFDVSIKIPLTFLIISTFSFIFAATIFSNAATELTLNKPRRVQQYMVYAKNIDELLGLYLFILATPMVIGAVTQDSFLRTVTILVAISGFALYSQSKFSVLDDELTRPHKRILSAVIVALSLLLYAFQATSVQYGAEIYSGLAVSLLAVLMITTYLFCKDGYQYNVARIRAFEDEDIAGISELMIKNINNIKPSKILKSNVEKIQETARPESIHELSKTKNLAVAEFKNRIVGFAFLDGHEIGNVLTDPKMQRKGIGLQLVEYLEKEAKDNGLRFITYTATDLDKGFYDKIGYEIEYEAEDDIRGTLYHMKKKLR